MTADECQSSLHLVKTSQCLHPVIDQTRCHCVETPAFGVQGLHLLLVSGIGLFGSYEDPAFDVLRDQVPYDRLQVWLLKAGVQEDKTLVCGIQIPTNCGLWTQEVQVPLPEWKEGSFGCVGVSLYI